VYTRDHSWYPHPKRTGMLGTSYTLWSQRQVTVMPGQCLRQLW
jgi:hypothetical protein